MLTNSSPHILEISIQNYAFAVHQNGLLHQKPQKNKDKYLWHDYCNKSNHTREICWKLHNKLANWKSKNLMDQPKMAYTTKSLSTDQKPGNFLPFTTKQIKVLKTLFSQSKVSKDLEPTTSNVTVSVAQQINFTSPYYLIKF